MHQIPGLYLLDTKKKGRGVFTVNPIAKNDIIEICPVIILPSKDVKRLNKTKLHDYYFWWNQQKQVPCIVLGYGSIYNHKKKANAEIIADFANETMTIKCIKKIKPHEEITLDYTGGGKLKKDLWFDVW